MAAHSTILALEGFRGEKGPGGPRSGFKSVWVALYFTFCRLAPPQSPVTPTPRESPHLSRNNWWLFYLSRVLVTVYIRAMCRRLGTAHGVQGEAEDLSTAASSSASPLHLSSDEPPTKGKSWISFYQNFLDGWNSMRQVDEQWVWEFCKTGLHANCHVRIPL